MNTTLPVPGTRIELIAMPDDPHPVAPGTRGTVTRSSEYQVHVAWDDGRALSVLPDLDVWRVLAPGEETD